MRWKLWALTVIAVLVAAACGGSGQSSGSKQLTIGIDNGSGSGFPYPSAIAQGIVDKANKLGVKVVANLDGKNDPQREASNVQDLVSQHPDGILLLPADAAAAAHLADQVAAANIKVMSVHSVVGANRKITDVYPKLNALVIENEVGAGTQAAQLVKKAFPSGAKIAVVLGQAGYAEDQLRLEGFQQVLSGSEYPIVAQQPGDWTATKGQSACANMLAAHPDIQVFYNESDDMGTGCAQAVQSAGAKAKVIGVGGSKLGIQDIKNGQMYGTICYKPYTEGQIAMQEMYQILTGKANDHAKLVYYETPTITAENVDQCSPQW